MNVWIVFLLGVFVGWLIEWIIDWLFWRRNVKKVYASDAQLRQELAEAEAQLASVDALRSQVSKLQAQLNAARTETTTVRQERDDLRAQLDVARLDLDVNRSSAAVDLGSGAVRADEASASRLRQEVESLRFERDALQNELNKARFAGATRTFIARDDLEQIDGIGPVYEQRLFAAGIDTYGQLAAATPEQLAHILDVMNWQKLNLVDWIEQARQFAKITQRDLLPDRMEEIKGIGPIYAKRLRAANIKSFEDLAASSPEQLEDILGKGRLADYASWIEQARAYARLTQGDRPPSELEQIKGIGPSFAARLEMAGVTDFQALSELTENQLKEIIGPAGWRLVNYERWMAQARQLVRPGATKA
jgi:predicted flap endonuclease-1-like 5' DNA nuclease